MVHHRLLVTQWQRAILALPATLLSKLLTTTSMVVVHLTMEELDPGLRSEITSTAHTRARM